MPPQTSRGLTSSETMDRRSIPDPLGKCRHHRLKNPWIKRSRPVVIEIYPAHDGFHRACSPDRTERDPRPALLHVKPIHPSPFIPKSSLTSSVET